MWGAHRHRTRTSGCRRWTSTLGCCSVRAVRCSAWRRRSRRPHRRARSDQESRRGGPAPRCRATPSPLSARRPAKWSRQEAPRDHREQPGKRGRGSLAPSWRVTHLPPVTSSLAYNPQCATLVPRCSGIRHPLPVATWDRSKSERGPDYPASSWALLRRHMRFDYAGDRQLAMRLRHRASQSICCSFGQSTRISPRPPKLVKPDCDGWMIGGGINDPVQHHCDQLMEVLVGHRVPYLTPAPVMVKSTAH